MQAIILDANGDAVREGDIVTLGEDRLTVSAIVIDSEDRSDQEVGYARLFYASGDDEAVPLFRSGVGVPMSTDIVFSHRNEER
jgi:hypothetical protein